MTNVGSAGAAAPAAAAAAAGGAVAAEAAPAEEKAEEKGTFHSTSREILHTYLEYIRFRATFYFAPLSPIQLVLTSLQRRSPMRIWASVFSIKRCVEIPGVLLS